MGAARSEVREAARRPLGTPAHAPEAAANAEVGGKKMDAVSSMPGCSPTTERCPAGVFPLRALRWERGGTSPPSWSLPAAVERGLGAAGCGSPSAQAGSLRAGELRLLGLQMLQTAVVLQR